MYCRNCECEFVGWTDLCPVCRAPLTRGMPPVPENRGKSLSHEELVALVREQGDPLKFDLACVDVGLEKSQGFPYAGFGFGWAKRLQGLRDGLVVDLCTAGAGTEKSRGFPYNGYGFAWEQSMEGHIAGNRITLAAKKVAREKESGFPYFGFGFSWTQGMAGTCGDGLMAELVTTEVGREKARGFPYLGYGRAWVSRAVLTLTLGG